MASEHRYFGASFIAAFLTWAILSGCAQRPTPGAHAIVTPLDVLTAHLFSQLTANGSTVCRKLEENDPLWLVNVSEPNVADAGFFENLEHLITLRATDIFNCRIQHLTDEHRTRLAETALAASRFIVTEEDLIAYIRKAKPFAGKVMAYKLSLARTREPAPAKPEGPPASGAVREAPPAPTPTPEPPLETPLSEEVTMTLQILLLDGITGNVLDTHIFTARHRFAQPSASPPFPPTTPVPMSEEVVAKRAPKGPTYPKNIEVVTQQKDPRETQAGYTFNKMQRQLSRLDPYSLHASSWYQRYQATLNNYSLIHLYSHPITSLVITSTPSGANVYLDRQLIGMTPLHLPADEGQEIVIAMDGYQTEKLRVPPRFSSIHVELKPLR